MQRFEENDGHKVIFPPCLKRINEPIWPLGGGNSKFRTNFTLICIFETFYTFTFISHLNALCFTSFYPLSLQVISSLKLYQCQVLIVALT